MSLPHPSHTRKIAYPVFQVCAVTHSIATAGAEALLPFYMRSLGASTALVGLPFVLNSVSRFFSDPFNGVVADRLSSKHFIILAFTIGAVASLSAAAVTGTALFLFLWMFVGVGESMFALGMRKVAFDNAATGRTGAAVGMISTLYGIGNVVGPPIGGYLGYYLGVRVLFLIYALPLLVCIGVSWMFPLPQTQGSSESRGGPLAVLKQGRKLLALPLFVVACLGTFYMFFSRWGAIKAIFPVYAVEIQGLTIADVGVIMGIAGIVDIAARYLSGIAADRWGAQNALRIGLLTSGTAFFIGSSLMGYAGLLGFVSGTAVGHGFLNVTITTLALQVAGPDNRGLALGMSRWFGSVGAVVGPFLIGGVAEWLGYATGFVTVAIVAVGLFGCLTLLSTRPEA